MNDIKQKQIQIITVIGLCIAIIGLTIAYATMSSTLNVSGSSNVKASEWDIHFDNVSASTLGDATYTLPTISTTSLSNYKVVLTKPGDSVSFDFKIVNGGNIPAELSSFIMTDPTCSSELNPSDADLVCDNLDYILTYDSNKEISVGDSLAVDEEKNAHLTVAYKEGATSLPTSKVTVSNLDVTFIYNQK